jgi:DNA modification methylase
MRWLVRLTTREGGKVLDPFAGTGITAEAAHYEGSRCTLIEKEQRYLIDIKRRMDLISAGPFKRLDEINSLKPQDRGALFV